MTTGTQDSALSPRLEQRLPGEGGAKVPIVTTLTLPPAAWPGMMVYDLTLGALRVFSGNEGGWITVSNTQQDTGNITYVMDDTPGPSADNVGDWWVDITDPDNPVLKYWDGDSWEIYVDPVADAAAADAAQALADALAASNAAAAAQSAADAAQAAADGKITTFFDPDPPTGVGESVGDLWFRDTDNKAFRYSGTEWVTIADAEIAQALQTAGSAEAIADGKIQTFFTDEEPTSPGIGDLWYDTDANNLLKRYNGTEWAEIPQPARAERIEGGTLYEEIQVAPGAGVTLQAGVSDPAAPPTLSQALRPTDWPAVPSGYEERGIGWDSNAFVWLRLLVPTDTTIRDTQTRVERIEADGTSSGYVRLGNVPNLTVDDYNSICEDNYQYYTMYRQTGTGWVVVYFDAQTPSGQVADYLGESPTTTWADTSRRPAIGKAIGGTVPLCTASWVEGSGIETGVYIKFRDGGGGHYSWASPGEDNQSIEADSTGGRDINFIEWHDLPAPNEFEFYVGFPTTLRRYYWNAGPTEYARDTAATIELLKTAARGGVGWKTEGGDEGFFSVHNDGISLYKYSAYVPVTNHQIWVTYADTNFPTVPTYITKDSPPANLAIRRGWYAQVALPPAGVGITTSRVYAGLGTALPIDANLDERPETLDGRIMLIDPSVAGGAGAPPPANTFPASGLGVLKSVNSKAVINGDGSATFEDADFPLGLTAGGLVDSPKTIQAGRIVITPVANTDTTVTLVFDTPFNSIPTVVAMPDSGAMTPFGSAALRGWEVANVTTTQCEITIYRTNTTATGVFWIAVARTQ